MKKKYLGHLLLVKMSLINHKMFHEKKTKYLGHHLLVKMSLINHTGCNKRASRSVFVFKGHFR